jgi:manganese transport protein
LPTASFWGRLRGLGPGLLVTAAFIGPGTVTTASTAGARFGYQLLWAILFSVLATIVLQEMAARLGLVTRLGLGEALRVTIQNPVARLIAGLLVVVAIGFGNAAYQTGNLAGAHLGMETLTGWSLTYEWPIPLSESSEAGSVWPIKMWPLAFAAFAWGVLWYGNYRIVERVLIGLVVVMSGVFICTACLVPPEWTQLATGLTIPQIPPEAWLTTMALIGTTVVPYNLFLHASAVQEKWPRELGTKAALRAARIDSLVSISIGGVVTMAIVATAAGALFGTAQELSGSDMARQLEPMLGTSAARIMFAIGLTAAGLTIAITAPLAAAYATAGICGWPKDLPSRQFRWVWGSVLIIGALLATSLTRSPSQVIVVAQVAGGILLPLIALFLLLVVNQSKLMGEFRNRLIANVLGGIVVVVTSGLGTMTLLRAFGAIKS